MTALAARRRHRTLAAGLSGLLVLGVAPVLGFVGVRTLQDSKEGTAVETLPVQDFPLTPTAMLATIDDQNVVTSIALMVLAAGGRGGTIVTLPTNTDRSQSAAEDHIPVADSLILSGEEGLISDVEAISYLSLGTTEVATVAETSALLAPLGPLAVNLVTDVVDTDADGNNQTTFVAGQTQMDAGQAATVLTSREASAVESRRLANVRAVWSAVAASIGQGRDVGTIPEGEPTSMPDFMSRMFAGPVQVYHQLRTRTLAGAQNPDKRDVGEMDASEIILVMAGLAPTAMAAPSLNPSFRVEDAFTADDLAGVDMTPADIDRNFIARVLFNQGNVLSVSNTITSLADGKVPDKTVILVANELRAADVEAFAILFGDVEYRTPDVWLPTCRCDDRARPQLFGAF